MTHRSWSRGGVAAAALSVTLVSSAPATHNVPLKADKTSVSFVTSYLECTGGILHDPASGATNACPAQRRSPTVSFDQDGFMVGELRVISPGKAFGPTGFIADGTVGPDFRIEFHGSGLNVGGSPYSGTVFLTNRPRLTDDGCPAPCTLFDVNGFYPYAPTAPPVCTGGSCFGVFSVNNALDALLPGSAKPIVSGIGINGEERGVCLMTAFANVNTVFACHGFVAGKTSTPSPPGFDHPRPGKASHAANVLVRAYEAAVPGPGCVSQTHIPPLDAFPACSAVESSAKLDFGPSGTGTLKLDARRSSQPRIEALTRLRDIRDGLTGLPFSGELSFRLGVRVTHAACDGGVVCTLPDKVVSIPVHCQNGRCLGRGDLDAKLPPGTVSLVEHTPLVTGTPPRPCVYDGPQGDASAEPFACVGIFAP